MNNKTLKKVLLSFLNDYPNAFSVDQIIEMLSSEKKTVNLNPAKVSYICRDLVNSKQLRRIGTAKEPLFCHMSNLANLGRVMNYGKVTAVSVHPDYAANLGSKFIRI